MRKKKQNRPAGAVHQRPPLLHLESDSARKGTEAAVRGCHLLGTASLGVSPAEERAWGGQGEGKPAGRIA